MSDPFPIIDVPFDAPEATEHMGSKPKFWFDHPDLGRCLFKFTRPNTGEDWSEKIASELAELLGLPHARVDLAACRGKRGIVSPTFVPSDCIPSHGNQILCGFDPDYPRARPGIPAFRLTPKHTVHRLFEVNSYSGLRLPLGMTAPTAEFFPTDVLVGYLMLDAWIGNTDRHDENWGWVVQLPQASDHLAMAHLAPTYDHASSLGRELSDEARERRLRTMEKAGGVEKYLERCRSALYDQERDDDPVSPLEAYQLAARYRPPGAQVWLDRLRGINDAMLAELLVRVPAERMTPIQTEFALRMLSLNRQRLLETKEDRG